MTSSSSFSISSSYSSSSSSDADTIPDQSSKKLSFHSLPSRFPPPEPPGAASPPLETPASVPFLWEVAPGKPRLSSHEHNNNVKGDIVTCLELPPRLTHVRTRGRSVNNITDMPSPTTVLDGPDRSLACGGAFRSFRSPESFVRRERVGYFGSSRWGGNVIRKSGEGNNDFSMPLVLDGGDGDCGGGGDCGVEMAKNRKGSRKSHLWESIYGSLKQVVPWKRRERARK